MEEAGIEIDADSEISTDNDAESDADTDIQRLNDYDLSDLEILLKEAIEEEDYAKASVLRDIINEKRMYL